MKNYQSLLLFFAIVVASCSPKGQCQNFIFKETSQGVEVMEDGHAILFYQREPKSLDGRFICNNYIHPLYSLDGDTLTEEFPVDHPYHRGIFWAWHQMYIGGASVGDGWFMSDVEQEILNVGSSQTKKSGQLKINAQWKSSLSENKKPFLAEETIITVYPRQSNSRIIDFSISLKALVPDVEIGGMNDEKGYGGFCARLIDQKKMTFTSVGGEIVPQLLQVEAGPWMDFSGPHGQNGEISGVTLFCHPETPNYPAPWVLRNQTSMQNCVYPGRNRITVPLDKPLRLLYRLVVHDGGVQDVDVENLMSGYEEMTF